MLTYRAEPPILFCPCSSRVELPVCTRVVSVQFRTWALPRQRFMPLSSKGQDLRLSIGARRFESDQGYYGYGL